MGVSLSVVPSGADGVQAEVIQNGNTRQVVVKAWGGANPQAVESGAFVSVTAVSVSLDN
jgi:hypothetical protein